MLIEILLAIVIGIAFGTLTGLIPGIHINLVGAILISLATTILLGLNQYVLVIFIVAMSITHTFIDFIPSIYLGCPDTDTELSVLPGHELLKEGKGHEAVLLSNYGSLSAIIIFILISAPLIILISKTYNLIEKLIPYILITSSFFLILLEKERLRSGFVFILSGILGILVLGSGIENPLLPLLTGLFGASNLILSIKNKTIIPEQTISRPKEKIIRPLIGASIASPICSFLPGMGTGQAAILGNLISKTNRKGFIILIGATNTLVMGVSFISLYVISKTRTGAALAIKEIIGEPTGKLLILIIFSVLLTGVISYFLTIFLSQKISQIVNKVNYKSLSIITIIILSLITVIFTGAHGIFILIVSTLVGIYSISLAVRRTNMMGCLLIPTIIFYLF